MKTVNNNVTKLIICILIGVIILMAPISNLSPEGHRALVITITTVLLWACNVAATGYIALLTCSLFLITGTGDAVTVFSSWSKPTYWMIIASFLFAAAVKNSGLAERAADIIILKYVRDWRSLILTIMLLNMALVFLIPHTFPRAFLILAIVSQICEMANVNERDTRVLCFAVFAIAVPVTIPVLTSDASINVLFAGMAGMNPSWVEWFKYMGVPGLIAVFMTTGLFLMVFKPTGEIKFDLTVVEERLTGRGALSGLEKKTGIWIVATTIFWLTTSMHHIDLTYGTMMVVAIMSLPGIGGIISAKDWSSIPINLLCFLTGAMAIGAVGNETGMTQWITAVVMPDSIPDNPYVIAAFITLMAMIMHMFLGSLVSVLAISIPILLNFTSGMCMAPECVAYIIYITLSIHYIFPFHNLALVSGGDNFTNVETVRLGIPMTLVTFFINVCICVPWWTFVHLI